MRRPKTTARSSAAACELVEWLLANGHEAKALAHALGVSPNTVSRWIRGSVSPGLENAIEVESITGVSARLWAFVEVGR